MAVSEKSLPVSAGAFAGSYREGAAVVIVTPSLQDRGVWFLQFRLCLVLSRIASAIGPRIREALVEAFVHFTR